MPAAETAAPTPAVDYGALKLETVKSLYAYFLNPEAGQAIGGIACIDCNPVVQEQDTDPQEIGASLAFRLLESGEVQVNFSNLGTAGSLRYVLVCREQQCLIDDLSEDTGTEDNRGSFKRRTAACLDELAKEVSF